jgi:uncharacterized protein (DUF58 family)
MSSFPLNDWLTPLLAELEGLPPLDLPLAGLGEGLRFGAFAGKSLEVGADLEESRPYQQGDPVRLINWRLTARSVDQTFVKYQPKPTELRAKILVDLRASLWQGTRGRLKAEQVVRMAFRVAKALSESVVVDTQVWSSVPESLPILRGRARWTAWTQAFHTGVIALSEQISEHEIPLADALMQVNDQWVIVLSDFVDWDEDLESALLDVHSGRQVLLIQVLDQAEFILPMVSGIQLGEGGFPADATHQQAYQLAMNQFLAHLTNWCADSGIVYWRHLADDGIETLGSASSL